MAGQVTLVEGGTVTTPRGFRAGATYAGLKTFAEDKLDLGLIISEAPCSSAGVYTQSSIKSPSVTVTQEHIKGGAVRAVVVNAGIANCSVGHQGYLDAKEMTALAAQKLGVESAAVAVCSTGVIGVELPMSLIRTGLDNIQIKEDGGHELARAMMTTDTRPKEVAVSFELDGRSVQMGGVTKGSGMIHPNMATMLSFVTTDAAVEKDFLDAALREVADSSFNMMTVDGDTSTNDTLLVLANGLAENRPINASSADAPVFKEALMDVCVRLAKEMARDGEGATRLITVDVLGATDVGDARKAARTIASSNLVKSAVYGSDPNWGRIMMALGRSGAAAEESKVDLFVNGVCIMEEGRPVPFHRDAVVALMRGSEVNFRLNLNLGNGEATAWGCDLTEEYVIINILMTKNCERDYEGSMRNLEESLRRLKTDYLDLWQFHEVVYDNDPDWIFEKGGIEAAIEARESGKVRFIGFTGHKDPCIHRKMLNKPFDWDTVQMPINVMDAHFRSFQNEIVPVCREREMGVIGMKSLGGGRERGIIPSEAGIPAEKCIRYALNQEISTLVVGMTSMADLKQNLAIARDFSPMSDSEQQELLDEVKEVAGDGRYERFKTSKQFDGPHHRKQHGFPVDVI